jgi:hypothetical protein
MFCNTYIMLCGLFMSKVLRLGFFYYIIIMYFLKIIFGLGSEFEID